MANATYGIVKPSLIDPANDVEIWYNYRPSRSSEEQNFADFRLIQNPETVLGNAVIANGYQTLNDGDSILPGIYTLNLPVDVFGSKGIYTIYIKPKEYFYDILDIGTLYSYPDTRGIVIETPNITDNSLIGYRVEYFEPDDDKQKRVDMYRLITSNNKCEPVTQTSTMSDVSGTSYRFTSSGTLTFITLTPSTSPSFNASATPFIGIPNQKIAIVNTKFDPVMIEVEMVDHDIETLSIMQEGDQVRNLDNGRVTTYNFDGEIYKQAEYFTVKDTYNTRNIAEVKTDTGANLDMSLDLEELKNS